MKFRFLLLLTFIACHCFYQATGVAADVPEPQNPKSKDAPFDDGTNILVQFDLQGISLPEQSKIMYHIERAEEKNGIYSRLNTVTITAEEISKTNKNLKYVVSSKTDSKTYVIKPEKASITAKVGKAHMKQDYYFRIIGENENGKKEKAVYINSPIQTSREWFELDRLRNLIFLTIFSSAVIIFIYLARTGMTLYVRRINGLEAIDEAVGRATEMGKPCLFVPGVQDLNDIQTIAGVTILSKVTEAAADFDAHVEVPTSRSLVMTAAKETMQAAYMMAGKPDGFNQDSVYYVTDEQFGYVAYITGYMVREKPSACFYFGSFYAESLILAETGNSIGSIQVAGTAQYSQLPFFVAACDYTLIGEELFAASAYLSGSPEELGSLKGQDVGKVVIFIILIVGTFLYYINPELVASIFG